MKSTRRVAAASAALLATAAAAVLTACGPGSSTPHPAAATSPLVATTVTATATVTAPAPAPHTATVTHTATAPAPAPVTRTVTVTRTRTVAAPAPAGICGPVLVAVVGPAAFDASGWPDHVFVCARTNMSTGAAEDAQISVQLVPSYKVLTVPARILSDAAGDQTGVTASVAGFTITMIGWEQLSCSHVTWIGSGTTWTGTMPVCGR